MIKTIVKKIRIRKEIKKNFFNELQLMKGQHKTNSTNTSILHFTVHRCASRYVLKIFKLIEKNSDMTHIRLGSYFWCGGKLYSSSQEIYKKFGYMYGPFLGMDKEELPVPIPNYDDFKIFLMLRDPRDVLTSFYFHHAFAPYPNLAQQEFINGRSREAMSKSIDEWVLEKAPLIQSRYEVYFEQLYNRSNVLFLKYEDMVSDFPSWLSKLTTFLELNLDDETIESILKTATFKVDKEDKNSHKRQVTPGDYKRKLKAETIRALNFQFEKILDALNYTI